MPIASSLMAVASLASAPSGANLLLEPDRALYETIIATDALLEKVAYCLDKRHNRKMEGRWNVLFQRKLSADSKLNEIWGRRSLDQIADLEKTQMTCKNKLINDQLNKASVILDEFDKNLDRHLEPRKHGLWIANIHFCNGIVMKADIGKESYADRDMLAIELNPIGTQLWKSLTERSINIMLDVSFDGKTIMRPNVHEPMNTGKLQITGPSLEELATVKKAALEAC